MSGVLWSVCTLISIASAATAISLSSARAAYSTVVRYEWRTSERHRQTLFCWFRAIPDAARSRSLHQAGGPDVGEAPLRGWRTPVRQSWQAGSLSPVSFARLVGRPSPVVYVGPWTVMRMSGSKLHQPLVPTILKKKQWFSDEPPKWPNAKTSFDAIKLSKKWSKRLRRKRMDQPPPTSAQLALANLLESCRPGARCQSGACPRCGRALQRFSVALILNVMARFL